MGRSAKLKIDGSGEFERLPNAPIIEAVIEIRAQAEAPWEEADVRERLKPKLQAYPTVKSKREFHQQLRVEHGSVEQSYAILVRRVCGSNPPMTVRSHSSIATASFSAGCTLTKAGSNSAGKHLDFGICTFNSRTQPRFRLRFINRMPLVKGRQLRFYLESPPKPPKKMKLALNGFFHQDRLSVPGQSYGVNITRTLLPAGEPSTRDTALILDIDVFTEEPFELQNDALEHKLGEMRRLKNRVFFGSITHKALESFR